MKRILGLLSSNLLLGALLLSAPAAEETSAVLGLLEIRGAESLAAAGFELSQAAGLPVPKEMISLRLYGALGTMPGLGIPPEGTIRAMAFRSDQPRGGWAVLLPVANEGADYLESLGQSGWRNEAETADGLLHFIAPPGGRAPMKEVYFLKRGETLVAAGTADDVRRAEALRPSLPPILPAEGDVVLQIRPAALAEAYGPQLAERMNGAFRDPELPAQAAAMGTLYARAYLAAARQIRECTLGLGVADGKLNLHARVAPVPETAFARWVATVRPPADAANVVALPEALAVEILNLGDLREVLPAYFRFSEKMLELLPAGTDPAAFRPYLDNEKASYAQLAGDVGFALLPPTKEAPLRFVQYAALKDNDAVRDLLPELVRGANDMAAALSTSEEELPFQIELALGEPREYRGIAVDRLIYAFQLDGTMAALWPAAVPTKFAFELAWIPGGLLAVVGDAALTETLVDRALDGGAAPLTAWPAWQALYPEPDARLVDTAHVALFDALRAYLALADAADGGQRAQQVPATAGNLETCSYVFDGLMTRIRFRLADIAAASEKIKELKAQRAYGNDPFPLPAPTPAAVGDPAPTASDEDAPPGDAGAPEEAPAKD